jgi:hypothetical protein
MPRQANFCPKNTNHCGLEAYYYYNITPVRYNMTFSFPTDVKMAQRAETLIGIPSPKVRPMPPNRILPAIPSASPSSMATTHFCCFISQALLRQRLCSNLVCCIILLFPFSHFSDKTAKSASVEHEIALLELAVGTETTGLGMEQIRECFSIFDEIIPKLGVYQVRSLSLTSAHCSALSNCCATSFMMLCTARSTLPTHTGNYNEFHTMSLCPACTRVGTKRRSGFNSN